MATPTEKTLPDYNYDAVMSIKKGKYYLHIKELQILGCGDDLNSAYKDLTDKKEQLIREFQEGENLNELPTPINKSSSSLREDFRQIRIFLMKLFIIAFLGVVALSFTKEILSNLTDPVILGIKEKVRVSKLGRFLLIQLDDAIESDITPDMEKQILGNIRILVKKLQPYANEFRPLLNPNETNFKTHPENPPS